MGYSATDKKKVTVKTLLEVKATGEKITQMTVYGFTIVGIIDIARTNSILMGDSVSSMIAGNQDTTPITIKQMIRHARSVVRACQRCPTVCDISFGSYQISREDGICDAIRTIKETGAGAFGTGGGREITDAVKEIVDTGILIIRHLSLTPQSIHKFGGCGLCTKGDAEAEKFIEDALALSAAGASVITLGKVLASLTTKTISMVKAATIGIGIGNGTDGQILVYVDALDMTQSSKPKFLRHFTDVNKCMTEGV